MNYNKYLIILALSSISLLATSIFSTIIIGIDLSAATNKLTQPVATLIAGIVGLGAIAYQTNKGFRNLIESQEHKAKLEHDGRIHIQELAAKERHELDHIKSIRLLSAIQGELKGLTFRYFDLSKHLALSELQHQEQRDQGVPFKKQSLKIERFDTPIIDACISDITIIDAQVLADISMLYAKVRYEVIFSDIRSYDMYLKIYQGCAKYYKDLSYECNSLHTIIHKYVYFNVYSGPLIVDYEFGIINGE